MSQMRDYGKVRGFRSAVVVSFHGADECATRTTYTARPSGSDVRMQVGSRAGIHSLSRSCLQ
jgi:hypothetical protein